MLCLDCGTAWDDGEPPCPHCGAWWSDADEEPVERDWSPVDHTDELIDAGRGF